MKIYPTDKDGNRIGSDREVSKERWEIMKKMKNLRWAEAQDLKKMTKRELVESFGLPEADLDLKKSEIIDKINQ